MKLTASLLSLGLGALQALATPVPDGQLVARAPTLYLAGDSTMARASDNTDGWGQYIGKYVNIAVVNKAIGGRSSRSYWNEGRFQEVAGLVKAGDIVVIEFGHNDGGSPTNKDNGRSVCGGQGTETCKSDKTGETVYTFPFYIIQASKLMLAKQATVILSSQTPNNLWEGGSFIPGAPRFVGYQKVAKDALASSSVTFVDHFEAVARMMKRLGGSATNALFPNDHTHTSPYGADLVSQAFAQAIAESLNGTTSLKNYVKSGNPKVY
jgi:rhamnogalacturonan acetylesterase